jgi:hypothetical protein
MTKEFFERGKQIAKWADNNMTKDEELKMRIEQDEQWERTINRKWQGLSDDEIDRIYCDVQDNCVKDFPSELYAAWIKAFKEKNA